MAQSLGMVDFGEMDHVRNADQKFWPSTGMSVAQTRNLFGLVYPLAVVNGVLDRVGGRSTGMVRPGFAGSQRLGWTTTGDSVPTYANFRAHTRAMLNLTLSGFSNVGQDIGGWDGKSSDLLYARWFAAATFYPFMWSHGKGDHEPYSHGEAVESAARSFLNLRYRLIPYLYSLHEQAHRTGMPVFRPIHLQEPQDAAGFRIDDQFFVGDNILVAPLFNDEGDRKLYLPKGTWYDLFGEQQPVQGGGKIERESVPLNRVPAYVRAGAVIPLGPAMQYTGEKPLDLLSVHVYGFAPADLAGNTRTSAFSLYEDDGLSIAYQSGEFQRTHLRFSQTGKGVRFDVTPESGDGAFQSVSRRGYRLQFHGIEGAVNVVRLDGKTIPADGRRNRRQPRRHGRRTNGRATSRLSFRRLRPTLSPWSSQPSAKAIRSSSSRMHDRDVVTIRQPPPATGTTPGLAFGRALMTCSATDLPVLAWRSVWSCRPHRRQ